MKKIKIILSLVVVTGLSLALFQNCGSKKSYSGEAVSKSTTDNVDVLDDGSDDSTVTPPSGGSGSGAGTGSGTPTNPTGGSTTGTPVSSDQANSLVQDALNGCKNALSFLYPSTIPSGGTLSGFVNGYYRGNNVASIQDGLGNLWITATSSTAKVTNINHFVGNVILCNLDLDNVSNSSGGNIFVVGGDVKNVSSFIGTVVVVDGNFTGAVTKSKMILVVKTPAGQLSGKIYNQ